MTAAWEILEGDALSVLPTLPAGHFHAAVTSPPYFGLRSYLKKDDPQKALELGAEKTPAEYVEKIVAVAREVRRVLRADGCFWLNIADSYAQGGHGGHSKRSETFHGHGEREGDRCPKKAINGLKPKDLCLVPERLLIALQADGWYVRSKVRWFKISPMPEPVRDRPTSAVEEIFLLTKQGTYYYDQEAERPSGSGTSDRPQQARAVELAEQAGLTEAHIAAVRASGATDVGRGAAVQNGTGRNTEEVVRLAAEAKAALGGYYREFLLAPSRNLWNWWEIEEEGSASWFLPNEPLKEEHFAAFPSELPRRCVSLTTSARGCCPACGAPWRRLVKKDRKPTRPGADSKVYTGRKQDAGQQIKGGDRMTGFNDRWRDAHEIGNRDPLRHCTTSKTTGWQAGCACDAGEAVPCRVLDPFAGSGRTILAALRLGRHATGIELNPRYAAMSRRRVADDNPLFNSPERADP